MDISDYRREFARFNSAFELACFNHRAGFEPQLRSEAIYEQYGGLFTREAVDDLRHAEESLPLHAGTERAGLHALYGAARIGHLETYVRELEDERARRESRVRVEWQDEQLSVHDVPKKIAAEPNANLRRELTARWADAIGSCNDLRAARLNSLHQAARTLQAGSYTALYEDVKRLNYTQLAASTCAFLQQTESCYAAVVAEDVARFLPGVALSDLHHADFFYFQRMSGLDEFFSAGELLKTYCSAMSGLGIRTEAQPNIHIDAEARPSKNPRAACFRINPPDDVRLLLAPIGGVHDYTVFFHEAGHAQHFGWTSSDLMKRHPEFVYSPDYATAEAYAFLLSNLFHDAGWLSEHLNLDPERAQEIARRLSLIKLYDVRRFCAKFNYEIALHDSTDSGDGIRSEYLAAKYTALQKEATLFERDPNLYLWDVDDGFYGADYLRAWAFEVGLREHLRLRYGRRWWASRKAGDELIDLWNTSSRYSVEELARLIGFGKISFDQLAQSLIASATTKSGS
ncbi:MAG: hypothetical protein ABR577_15955 [Pyrinomonadaceae bacterium]